ncbi:MAG: AgmX/PglI C-terminal domain-containing protein [Myxococcales bacterium]|nr:AgmX/PglI C-terminal domain-containing protein [Myxococcales bacterium]
MAGPNTSLIFKIFKGDELLREDTLSQAVIKVGKLSSSHLRLEDESVSRMHAVIEVSGDDISIIDLGSTTGTVVNGQKINKAKLQDGDTIVLGDIRLELSRAAVEALAESVAAPAVPPIAAPGMAPAIPAMPAAPAMGAAPMGPPAIPMGAAQFAPAPMGTAPMAPPPMGAAPMGAAPMGAAPMGAAPMGAAPMGAAPMAAPAFGADAAEDMGGARAIEVAAMLGDSVVGVKHVMNPRGGKVTPITYGLFGFGALLLIISSIAFVSGVSTATDNKARYHKHVDAKKPAHEFRPRRLNIAFDWMAVGGLIGGMFCMTMGALRIREEKVDPRFRIGRASGVDFPTENSPHEDFNLVAPIGDDFVLNFAQGWEGELTVDGQSTALSELAGQNRARQSSTAPGAMEVAIPTKARIRVKTGAQSFLVSSVPQPRRQAAPLFSNLDTALFAYIAGAGIVVIGFVLMLSGLQPDENTLYGDAFATSDRMSHTQNQPQDDPLEEEEELDDGEEEDSGGTGTKMAEAEGKMGKKESNRATGQYAMKNNDASPQLAKAAAMDHARKAGVLGLMSQAPGGAFASITGAADFSSGLDDRDVYGGLLGSEVGEMAGGWGYGTSGVGPGGGGTGWGTIGTGNYGTIGHGRGTGLGYGSGSGKGGMRGRKAKPPQVRIGKVSATGDLDKNIIRRYIRRKLPRIRHCYEKELLAKPGLSGTVVTQFLISSAGSVQGAKAKGMGNSNVESCVASTIKSIQFPKPKGGGMVNVTYPFTFQPAG